MIKRFSFFLIYAQIFFSCVGQNKFWDPQAIELPALQKGAPSFSLAMLMQEPVEVLFFNVFAPDCTYCLQELPALNEFYQKHKDNPKIKFVGIASMLDAMGGQEPLFYDEIRPDVENFVKSEKINFPVYLAATPDFASLSVTAFPETFVLAKDKKGRIYLKRKFISVVGLEDLENYLPSL